MSPILFNLVVDTIADKLWKDGKIDGVRIASIEYKLAFYANKIVFFLSNPLESFKVLQTLLVQFGGVSGYKINQEKKSFIMGIDVTEQLKEQIRHIRKVHWQNPGIWVFTYWKIEINCTEQTKIV